MFNRLIYSNCLCVAKRHVRELVGTNAGIEGVVGHRVVVGVIDGSEVVVSDVKRRTFTTREVADQIRMVDAEGTW